MSEEKFFSIRLRVLLLAGVTGAAVSAACLAAMAAWMVSQKCSGSMAYPLAVAAVSAGSLFSGWVAAFCQKERGLLCGLIQGLFCAVLLATLSLPSGLTTDKLSLLRFAAVILCGGAGGLLGMMSTGRKRRV